MEVMVGAAEENATGIDIARGELSGRQSAYDEEQFQFAMKHLGKYKCALNFLWLAQPRISSFPLREESIKSQQEHDFPEGPQRINRDIVVQIPHVDFKPGEHKGALRVLSPEEPLIAFVRSLADALAKDVVTQETKDLYKAILLDVPVVFELIEVEENAKFRAVAIREQIVEDFFNMALTTWQRMLEVWSFRTDMIRLTGSCDNFSAATLSKLYVTKGHMSKHSELPSLEFIDCTCTFMKRAYSLPAVKKALGLLEKVLGQKNPFDSAYKYHPVITKTKPNEALEWVFCSFADHIMNGDISSAGFSIRFLKGDSKNFGLVRVISFKKAVLDYLLDKLLGEFVKCDATRKLLREKFASHASYRAFVCPFENGVFRDLAKEPVDMTWMASFKESAVKVANLIEKVCYTTAMHPNMRVALKHGKSAEKFVEDSCKDATDEIKVIIEKEEKVLHEDSKTSNMDGDGEDSKKDEAEKEDDADELDNKVTLSLTVTSGGEGTTNFEAMCARKVKTGVWFAVLPKNNSPTEMCKLVKAASSGPNPFIGNGRKGAGVGIIWDQPAAGETTTAPHLRAPPWPRDEFKKLIQGTLRGRSQTDDEDDRDAIKLFDVLLISDGGKSGNISKIFRCLGDMNAANKVSLQKKKNLLLGFEEVSFEARKFRSRGNLNQQENFFFIPSKEGLQLPERKLMWLKGTSTTNRGNILSPIPVPEYVEQWAETFEMKRKIFQDWRKAPSGSDKSKKSASSSEESSDDDDDVPNNKLPPAVDHERARTTRNDDAKESVFYHNVKSVTLWRELMKSYCLGKGIISILTTPELVVAALLERIPVYAFTFSEDHTCRLEAEVQRVMLKEMADDKSPAFESGFAAALTAAKKEKEKKEDKKDDQNATPKKEKKKDKKEDKKKEKKKKEEKSESESEDSSSGSSESGASK